MAWIDARDGKCEKHGVVTGDVYECDECGGAGEVNNYESDPLWYGSEEDGWEPEEVGPTARTG